MSKEIAKITEKDIPTLKLLLKSGMSYSEIGKRYSGINYRTVAYYIRKLGLQEFTKQHEKEMAMLGDFFEVIDTPEKAYVLGFILGDGYVSERQKDYVEISVSISDKCVVDFIANVTKSNVYVDMTTNKAARKFPSATITKTMHHIGKHLGGRLKQDRHYPRVKPSLNRFLLLGFFDADGSITYGHRRDRNRFWANIAFTHHLKCLSGLQAFLCKELDISTMVYPKSDENAYVIKFAGKDDVMKFINYLYPDDSFVVLRRKYEKAEAVRLELGEIGETTLQQAYNTEPSHR